MSIIGNALNKVREGAAVVVNSKVGKVAIVGGALALPAAARAEGITSSVLTSVSGAFTQVQTLGESASTVAATLALISVAVAFIWRAKG